MEKRDEWEEGGRKGIGEKEGWMERGEEWREREEQGENKSQKRCKRK